MNLPEGTHVSFDPEEEFEKLEERNRTLEELTNYIQDSKGHEVVGEYIRNLPILHV